MQAILLVIERGGFAALGQGQRGGVQRGSVHPVRVHSCQVVHLPTHTQSSVCDSEVIDTMGRKISMDFVITCYRPKQSSLLRMIASLNFLIIRRSLSKNKA